MSFNLTESDSNFADLRALNVHVLNVTRNVPVEYSIVLFGFITPIFFLITVVANIIIVVVLSRPDMRTPTNQVLLAMAVADLLTLVFPVPWYLYLYTFGNYRHLLHPAPWCYLYNYMMEALPAFFHTASIWCTILLACQRYIYICHPSTARIWCTNKRVTRIICFIFAAAFMHQSTRFVDVHYEDVELPVSLLMDELGDAANNLVGPNMTEEATQSVCSVTLASWVVSHEDLYFGSYFMFRIIFVHIIPCTILVIFNLLLYSALKKAEQTRAKLFLKHNMATGGTAGGGGDCTNNGSRKMIANDTPSRTSISIETRKVNKGGLGRSSGRDANSTTFMLIVVVTVFLVVEIPLAITTVVHVIENVFKLELVTDRFLSLTIIFTNFFIIISYPLNFAIYCGMSRAFRETFQQIFIRRIIATSGNNHNNNNNNNNNLNSYVRKHSLAIAKSTTTTGASRTEVKAFGCANFISKVNGGDNDGGGGGGGTSRERTSTESTTSGQAKEVTGEEVPMMRKAEVVNQSNGNYVVHAEGTNANVNNNNDSNNNKQQQQQQQQQMITDRNGTTQLLQSDDSKSREGPGLHETML